MSIVTLSTYRFTDLSESELPRLRTRLQQELVDRDIKGSVLLSTEGVNLSVAGTPTDVAHLKTYFATQPLFNGLNYRESWSDTLPFARLLVKIKPEIVSFCVPGIVPHKQPAPYIEPAEFKRWYDEGRDMLVLDVRNNYEIQLGSFDEAVHLDIRKFKEFSYAIDKLSKEKNKDRPVVTFCTGGIRCEKAAPYLKQQGFKHVFQLEGGIINYFKTCGQQHYHGECFMFDKRIAVDTGLQETSTIQCLDCRSPLTASDQARLESENACPYCGNVVRHLD